MKLFSTSTLLLVAQTYAGEGDGNYGAYPMIDWAAVFVEEYLAVNTDKIKFDNSAGSANTVGLNPHVTQIMTTHDGGKLMSGFGLFDNTTHFGWVIKLFGTSYEAATFACAMYDKPTNYTTFDTKILQTTSPLTTQNCKTQSQWMTVDPAATIAHRAFSSVFLSIAEDFTSAVIPFKYYVGGGRAYAADYGLGNYNSLLIEMDKDGTILVTGTQQAVTGIVDSSHKVGQIQDTDAVKGTNQITSGCVTAMDSPWVSTTGQKSAIITAGNTASAKNCLDWAIDGFNISGEPFVYYFADEVFTVSASVPAATVSAPLFNTIYTQDTDSAFPAGQSTTWYNNGGVTGLQTQVIFNTTTGSSLVVLISGRELYTSSHLVGFKQGAFATWVSGNKYEMKIDTFGQINAFWGYSNVSADANLTTSLWTHLAVVGSFRGKGRYATVAMAGTTLVFTAATDQMDDTTYCNTTGTTNGMCLLNAPAGGIAQFKGLVQGTTEDKYVEVSCHGIQPYYYNTRWQTITAANNGFVLTCMTGISQCQDTLAHGTAADPLSVTERANCLKDPRYLTWRMMTVKINYKGGQQWARTDSYWDVAAYQPASTWGPSIKLSTHYYTDNDNNGVTDLGKTYVFAMGDGSGVALHHLSFADVAPTTNTVAGTGSNVLVTAKASYTTAHPDQYSMDFCQATNLEIAGASTEDLADAVKAFTDGYYVKSTVALRQQFAGGADSWVGTCLVYYESQYVQDNTDGALCHVVMRESTTTAGPRDFGSSILVHITSATWYPPQREGSVTPPGSTVSDAKYGLVHSPSVATANVLYDGYYATATWYQPTMATTYAAGRRYGRGDIVGAYCMQGAGSTSYFQQHAEPVTLTSAMALIAGTSLLFSTVIAL